MKKATWDSQIGKCRYKHTLNKEEQRFNSTTIVMNYEMMGLEWNGGLN